MVVSSDGHSKATKLMEPFVHSTWRGTFRPQRTTGNSSSTATVSCRLSSRWNLSSTANAVEPFVHVQIMLWNPSSTSDTWQQECLSITSCRTLRHRSCILASCSHVVVVLCEEFERLAEAAVLLRGELSPLLYYAALSQRSADFCCFLLFKPLMKP